MFAFLLIIQQYKFDQQDISKIYTQDYTHIQQNISILLIITQIIQIIDIMGNKFDPQGLFYDHAFQDQHSRQQTIYIDQPNLDPSNFEINIATHKDPINKLNKQSQHKTQQISIQMLTEANQIQCADPEIKNTQDNKIIGKQKKSRKQKKSKCNVPKFRFYKGESNSISDQLFQCIICQDKYNSRKIIKILSCKHHFHLTCIRKWSKRKQSCPNCRVPFHI